MLRIGITGGIGSGKTTVSKIFEVLGIPVYYADDAARKLMNEDESLQLKLTEHFGSAIYENGILNRALLSSIVFNNKAKLDLLNSIVHPATLSDAEIWMEKVSKATEFTPYAIKEAALIFESGAQKKLDYVIGVHAPYKLRLQRAMLRDNLSKEDIEARMAGQMDETKKMNLCNFIITNDENQMLIPQVVELHGKLLAM
jgi:dephospho-CoA kinase